MDALEVDVLVCGGGMSGLACAAFAAEAGAKTLVVEKQGTIGGSSSLSAGMLCVYCPLFTACDLLTIS
jgi:flavin-dependent dehydrogenase